MIMLARLLSGLRKPTPSDRQHQVLQGLGLGLLTALIVLLLWTGNIFSQWRLRIQDTHYVPLPTSETIVLIAIDDASLGVYGRAPVEWSRSVYADLVRTVTEGQPRVIAFDLLFPEQTEDDAIFASAIQQARSSEARVRTVLGAFGVVPDSGPAAPSQELSFDRALLPVPMLADVSDYRGFLNTYPDVDGVIRRQTSLLTVAGEKQLSFSLATYLAYLRVPASAASQVLTTTDGQLQIAGDRTLNVDGAGLWIQNFFGEHGTTFATYSLSDVLNGVVSPDVFEDKIVLVGVMNATGLEDNYWTPNQRSGRQMAGVEIYANAIETLIQGASLREQGTGSQAAVIVLMAVLAAMLYAQIRWYWMLLSAILLLALWVLFAYTYFGLHLEMLNLFHPALALLLPVPLQLGVDLTSEIRRRQRSEVLLNSVNLAARQRLSVDRIAQHFASDVQRLLPSASGRVWVRRPQQSALQSVASWPTGTVSAEEITLPEPLPQQIRITQHTLQKPVFWQETLVGFLHLNLHTAAHRASLRTLDQLCEQIAPLLHNAILHEEVDQQRGFIEAVLHHSPAGILVVDDRLTIRHANPALIGAFSLSLHVADGQSLSAFAAMAKLTPEAVLRKLQQSIANRQAFRDEIQCRDKTFIVEASTLRDADTTVITFSDVTALAQLSETKTRMIRMASHDLKNPLGVIGTYLSLILEYSDTDALTEQNRRYLENIARAADDMAELITDVLDLEHVGSEQRTLTRIDLRAQILSVVEHHRLEMERKTHTLELELADDVNAILGDNRGITQALSNLMGNAVKYTPDAGHVKVRLWQEGRYAKVEVEDTGYGIPIEAQREVFQPFYRVRTKTTQHIKGTGLGLSLVKAIIEANNGRVWFRSEEGVGSTFGFELPMAQHEEAVAGLPGDVS